MKRILLALVGVMASFNLLAHGSDESAACSHLDLYGDWKVFYPNGAALKDQLEQGAVLKIMFDDKKKISASLSESAWEATDLIESSCVGIVPTAAIEVKLKSGGEPQWLCVDRVYFYGFEKREGQLYPKFRQIGTAFMSKDDCLKGGLQSQGVVNPGHAHADD